MTRTVFTIKQQKAFLSDNRIFTTWTHRWSSRGMGNSKIILNNGDVIGKASGCGYDRFGSAIGNAMTRVFGKEIHALAKAKCKGKIRTYKQSPDLYGMFYNAKTGKAWLDGACGFSSMETILNKLGFSLEWVTDIERANNGESVYKLIPVTKTQRRWIK